MFYMESTGNLVINKTYDNTQLWSSNSGNSGVKLVMQVNGNLVEFNSANKVVWTSNTPNHFYSILVLQDDGNLVVNQPLWASDSSQNKDTTCEILFLN